MNFSFRQALASVQLYERAGRGFWLMLSGFALAFAALSMLPPELLSGTRTRAALAAGPLFFFAAGFLAPAGSLTSPARAAFSGALCALAALGASGLAAGAQLDWLFHPIAFCSAALGASLGSLWGLAQSKRSQEVRTPEIAYVEVRGSAQDLAHASLLTCAALWPKWAAHGHAELTEDGSWRLSFPGRPTFHLAVDASAVACPDEPANSESSSSEETSELCVIALARTPATALFGSGPPGASDTEDPQAMRALFCPALARELPSSRPAPLG